MTKLSDAQITLLTQAATADSGAILPPSEHKRAALALIKRGLFIASPQPEGASRLMITNAGRAAIAADEGSLPGPGAADAEQTGRDPAPPEPVSPTPKPPSKLQVLVDLLRRPGGAGIEEMMAATGWRAHSVRGALSGSLKKAMKLDVLSEKTEGGRRYRIADATAESAAA